MTAQPGGRHAGGNLAGIHEL